MSVSTRPQAETLQELQNEITAWQVATFPESDLHSMAVHLVDEAFEVLHDPKNLEEMADCWILLLGMAARCGYNEMILLEAIRLKMEINKERKWGAPDRSGVYRHVEPQTISDDKFFVEEKQLGDFLDTLPSAEERRTA